MTDPLPPRSGMAPKTVAVITVLSALVAGMVLGLVADRVYLRHFRQHAPRNLAARIVMRLDRSLNLTPQQHDQVVRILDEHRQRIEAINATTRPQVRRELDAANQEIEKILTPEQRLKFSNMRMRMRRQSP